MSRNIDPERIYAELRGRAVAEFGEERAAELEDFLRTTASQTAEVEQAHASPGLEPLLQG